MRLEDPKTLEARVPEAFTGEKAMRLPKPFVFTSAAGCLDASGTVCL